MSKLHKYLAAMEARSATRKGQFAQKTRPGGYEGRKEKGMTKSKKLELLRKLDQILKWTDANPQEDAYSHMICEVLYSVVSDIQTADDVPGLRCKDCRHCEDRKKYLRCVRRGFTAGHEVKPEDYCSYGEPKEAIT